MKRGLVISTLALGGILFSFQNCSQKVGFGSNAEQSTPLQSLVATDGSSSATSTTPPSEEQGQIAQVTHETSQPEIEPKKCNHPEVTRAEQSEASAGSSEGSSASEESSGSEQNGDYVACILVDHGKSLKLGLLTEELGGVHAVSESVCITRTECLGAVAKAFEVEGAYDRGYCKHNPHVKRLTNAQVDALLAHHVASAAP